ncbi:MAG TPA: Hsp20/alpha crystallin family protein [Thermoplasmatales archaeon]|nr:Hsp20/alpha crystallin family protein [Thermoplasmatales archaeon]
MVRNRWPFGRDRKEDNPFDDWFEDLWPRRWSRDYFDIFDEFEDHFRNMQRRMNRLFRDAMSGRLPSPEEGGPYVYGWSFRIGSDGKPVFQEFGNLKGLLPGAPKQLTEGREPLIDLQETDDAVQITAEVPGISKNDINIEVTGDTLTINVDSKERKYYKEVQLPCEVDPDSAEATYNNGVLDITLRKVKPKKRGKKIKIK